jgi:penicillin-binding protein 1A
MIASRAIAGRSTRIDFSTEWGEAVADIDSLNDIEPWEMAVVLRVSDEAATIGLRPDVLPNRQVAIGAQDRCHPA